MSDRPQNAWATVSDQPNERVRRFKVPGGWLYQVEFTERHESVAPGTYGTYRVSWYPPVFVPSGEP